MTTEEQLKELQDRFDNEAKRVLRDKRISAAVWGVMSIVALLALVYAFFQGAQANKARIQAEQRTAQAESEIILLNKRILEEIEKSKACENFLMELQSLKAKAGK